MVKTGNDPYAAAVAVQNTQVRTTASASPAQQQQQYVQMTSLSGMYQQAQAQRQQIMQVRPQGEETRTAQLSTSAQASEVQMREPIARVDPAKLWEAWQRYMVRIRETNGQLYGSMGVGPQLASDGITVEVRIASQYEVDNFEKNTDLYAYLREATGNNHLVIKAVIDPKIAKERAVIYTATQKLEKMIEKNPLLGNMMRDMGLTLG